MSVQIVSTTDSLEQVNAALGGLAQKESKEETQSAPAQKEQGEKAAKASEALEEETKETKGEEPDESEDHDEDSKDEDGEKNQKRKPGIEKKISKLTRRVSEREQEIERLRQENDALRRSTKPADETSKPEAKLEGEPKPEEFDTHADYIKAVAKWTLKVEAKEAESKKQAEESEREYKKLQSAHISRLQEFVKTQTDFDEVIADYLADHGDMKFSDTLEEAILTSDLGPAIVYELARNPEELKRINSLGVVQAGKEIGKLEAKLAKAGESSKTAETKTTKAPPPVKPVGSAKSGAVIKSVDEMSFQEYKKARAEGRI